MTLAWNQLRTHSLVILKYTEPEKTGTNQGIPSHTYGQALYYHNSPKSCEGFEDKKKGW